MGCQSSLSSQRQTQNRQRQQEFKLNYRQFIMNTRGSIFQFYHFSTAIHRSASGVIRKVYHRTSKVQKVCKIRQIQNIQQLSYIQEVETLCNIAHPNVVKIQQYFIQEQSLYIIYQYIDGCTLKDKLKNTKQISYYNVLSILKQLLSAVNIMHSKGIAHRSINPSNIMLLNHKDQEIVKLIGFDQSVNVESLILKPARSYHQYQGVFNSKESILSPLKHDVYSCGLIFILLLGGSKYLNGIRGYQKPKINQFLSDKIQIQNLNEILCGLLNRDPNLRPNVTSILNNKIFKNIQKSHKGIILNNMRNYKMKSKLKTTLCMFATIKIPNLNRKLDLIQQFSRLDKNKDGKISEQQLCHGLMKTFHLSRQEASKQAQEMLSKIDQNNNRQLDFYEFAMGGNAFEKSLSQNQLRYIFSLIDVNKDGVITPKELHQTISDIQDFQLLAQEGNKLNFQRFKDIMKSYSGKIIIKNK